jgi:cardiolipin synthase A/B
VLLNHLQEYLPQIATFTSIVIIIVGSCHVLLYKSDSKAAISWIGIIWLVPLVGGLLYFIFGINRVRRLAKELRLENSDPLHVDEIKDQHFKSPDVSAQFLPLTKLGFATTKRNLTFDNKIVPLFNGDEAYPAMLKAIEQAELSITLSTYIFDNDQVGRLFISALAAAVKRKVKVRVLIDDIGLRYSFRPVLKKLKAAKVPVARFMGAFRPMTFPHMNLRKHRKILVVDGKVAFTGGMNIRTGHMLALNPKHPVVDLHFMLSGPIVGQLQQVFADDWFFTTKKRLQGHPWFVPTTNMGQSLARVITDGPDEDIFKLPMIIEGAISCARKNIWIITPYFLPELSLSRALNIAANKGVQVNIILPGKSNIPPAQWAAYPDLKLFLSHGCRIWYTGEPFDHSKLMLIDDEWILFGSANLDPRSLRLNFEMNVECYDQELARQLKEHLEQKTMQAHQLTLREINSRSLLLKLRDGVARLFSPYL